MAATELRRVRRSAIAFAFLGVGVSLGIALALITPEPQAPQTIEWLDNPRSLGRFSLETEASKFDNQSLMGRWTIVMFGFLHCPDVCPTSLSQLAKLTRSLAENSVADDITYVFVSVDPARDSVADVGRYVRRFDSSIRGVTGSAGQLMQFAGDLGARFRISADDGDYTVAHSITFSIIGPEGAFRGRFRPGFDLPNLVGSITSKVVEDSRQRCLFTVSPGLQTQC